MSAVVEEMCNERALLERKKIARMLVLTKKLSYEEIAASTELTVAEVEMLAGQEMVDDSTRNQF